MQFLDLPFFERAIRGLMAFVCQLIYPLIAWLYDLFINISKVNILSEGDVAPIYQRVTMLLTIIMVFYVTFQFVKYIVQPDEITDKEKGTGKIIYKMIMVVLLIAFVPRIFEGAFWVQSKIIGEDLIGKVLLGQATNNVSEFGQNFSSNIFSMFYSFEANPDIGIEEDEDCDGAECKMIVSMNLNFLRERGSLEYLTVGLYDSKEVETSVVGKEEEVALINFNYFMAVIVGAVVAWMLVMYCIEAGVRWAQLVFLQIIAPIPIIGYLSPKKDGIFQKWLKQCITTYIDLFLRMAIIYFVLLVCQILSDSLADGTLLAGLEGVSDWMKNFTYIALILGLMVFAKKAPKMLGELFPKSGAASGNFGLSSKERFAPITDGYKSIKKGFGTAGKVLNTGKMAVGGAAGALAGAAMGARTGRFFSGMVKGAKAGGAKKGGLIGNVKKGVNDVRRDVEKDKDIKEDGGSYYGSRFMSGHYESQAKKQDRKVTRLENMTKKKKAVADAIGDVKFRKQMDTIGESLRTSGNENAAKNWDGIKKQAEKAARNFADGRINAATFEQQMSTLVSGFNTKNGTSVNISTADLETSNTAKWTKVKTTLEDAKTAAKDINGEKYTALDGSEKTIEYNEATFADDIGDITDGAESAATQIKTSSEYKKAHANSKGANNGK